MTTSPTSSASSKPANVSPAFSISQDSLPSPESVLQHILPQMNDLPPFATPVLEANVIFQWALNRAGLTHEQQRTVLLLLADYYKQPCNRE